MADRVMIAAIKLIFFIPLVFSLRKQITKLSQMFQIDVYLSVFIIIAITNKMDSVLQKKGAVQAQHLF